MANQLIGVYARTRQMGRALALYESLLQSAEEEGGLAPNEFTYGNVLNALAKVWRGPGCT